MKKISQSAVATFDNKQPIAVRARLRGSKGQTLMEFAFIAPLFFLLIFAVMDFGRMFFVQVNVQQAVQEAARFASTGNHLANPSSPGNNLSRVASIVQMAQQSAWAGANMTNVQVSSL